MDIHIKEMTNRFLGWKLPSDFAPDCGISFKRESDYKHPEYGCTKFEPVGTNLFTAEQAEAMLHYAAGPVIAGIEILTAMTIAEKDETIRILKEQLKQTQHLLD